MKKLLIALVYLFTVVNLSATADDDLIFPQKFWIRLPDRPSVNELKLSANPSLSEASLKRRSLQNIPLTANDYPVNPQFIAQIRQQGFKILNVSRWFNSVTVLVENKKEYQRLKKLSCARAIEPVGQLMYSSFEEWERNDLQKIGSRSKSKIKASMDASNQDKSNSIYGKARRQTEMIGLDDLHRLGYDGSNVVIAILDAGFYNADRMMWFDSLFLQQRILGTRDFVSGGSEVFEDNPHGMSVLSCMAANIPGQMVGTAPSAAYWLLRSEDAGSEYIIEEDNWVSAAEFADSVGAWIINSSLGYTRFDDEQTSHTYSDMDGNTTRITQGADIAAAKGILVVNSAGNSGSDSWQYVGAPADGDSVLSIGAVDSVGTYAFFSSQGPSFDGRVKPNVSAMGQATWLVVSSGSVGQSNGTSFSSPIIAGAAACLWQAFPNATNMEIYRAIEKSAHQFERPDNYLGYGIPDFSKAFELLAKERNTVTQNDSIINLFPNPAGDAFTLEVYSSQKQNAAWEVLYSDGRTLASGSADLMPFSINQIPIELKGQKFASGEYVVKLTIKGGMLSRRFIKT